MPIDYDAILREAEAKAGAATPPPRACPVSDLMLVERARAYIAKMPPAISGQGGHSQTLCVARVLVHDFALSEADAWALLNEYNAICQPPWSEKELRHKLSEALKLSHSGQCESAFAGLRDAGCDAENAEQQEVKLDDFISRMKAKMKPENIKNEPKEKTSNTNTAPADEMRSRHISELLKDPALFNPPPRIPTGFVALDKALGEGIVPSSLVVLAGLTGRGKSTLTANFARKLASAGKRVTWFSLEDEDLQAARKLVAQDSNVAVRALEQFFKENAVTAMETLRVQSALPRLGALPLWINGVTTDLAAIEREIEFQKTDIALIDQSSWVKVVGKETPFEEASEISRRLKVLAKRLKIIVVALVQVNRAGAGAFRDGQDIELFHIRDSGRWEQDAQVVLIIQSTEDLADGNQLMRVDLKKHTFGKRDLRMHFKARLASALVDDSPEHLEPVEIGVKSKSSDDAVEPRITPATFAQKYFSETPTAPGVVRVRADGELSGREVADLIAAAVADGHLYEWKRGKAVLYATVAQPLEPPNVPTESKRGPGRPAKADSSADAPPVKRPVGRPRKINSEINSHSSRTPPIPPTTAQ